MKPIKTRIGVAVMTVIASHFAHAGAFSLYTEGSAAAIGNYAAGIAAEGADASIGWYNPAGLILLKHQEVVLSGVGVLPSNQLSGTSTFNTEGFAPYVQTFEHLQGAKNALVPALHYVRPVGERVAFGVSVLSPFGLSTNWSETSPVRYAATFTELLTLNLSPEMGVRLTDHFSLGAGVDMQWARVKFNRELGSPAALQALQEFNPNVTPTTLDSLSYNQGDSFGVGFHVGALGMFHDNHTRIGLNYQSKIEHTFQGYSQLTGRLADPSLVDPNAVFRSDSLLSNDIELPSVVTLSAYQDISNKLALLGSVVYTEWSTFRTTQLNNVAAFSSELGTQVLVNSVAHQNYRDVWRFALGANYHLNEQWMMRVGGGYDQTPTVNAQRDVRLPDVDRFALSIGAHYQMRPTLGFDIGYTYLFANGDSNINKTDALGTLSSYNVNAVAKDHAQLVGLQVVWDMDQPAITK